MRSKKEQEALDKCIEDIKECSKTTRLPPIIGLGKALDYYDNTYIHVARKSGRTQFSKILLAARRYHEKSKENKDG